MELAPAGWWLWLFGPCGSGKTAAGFELYRQFRGEGRRVGFIELDQLGICLPDSDPVRAPVKTANLLAALQNFHGMGAAGVIVSGDLAGDPMDRVLRTAGEHAPALIRLRATTEEYEARLRRRGAPSSYIAWSRSYDATFARAGDIDVDTSGLTVEQVAARIRNQLGRWWPRCASGAAAFAPGVACGGFPGGRVALICGPTPAGKSAVAWQVFMKSVREGVPAAYLDLAQVGFLSSAGDAAVAELKARNLEAIWRHLAGRGAQRLVLSGEVTSRAELDRYRRGLGRTGLRIYTLTATVSTLISRAALRGQGDAIELPGDELRGRRPPDLERIARASAAAAASRPPLPGACHVTTDDRDPESIADEIVTDAFASR